MKEHIKGNWVFLALLFCMTIVSCRKEEEIVLPLDDNSLPSGALGRISIIGKSGNTIRLGLDVVVFRDSKNIEVNLKAEAFSIDTLINRGVLAFKLDGVSFRDAGSKVAYSALMLMDQSGSISSTDRNNFRLDAAKAFCSNLGEGNNVALWSFPGNLNTNDSYTTDTAEVIARIEELRNRQGGGTPLYISQVTSIDFAADKADKQGKAVLTFTDGGDNGGGYTPTQVAERAKDKNIKLYNIGLGSAEADKLCVQAVATGGAFMFAKDARQLISMFGNLGKLLDQTARFYRTEWTVTKNSDFTTSGSFTHELKITLPYGGQVVVPFTVDY